MSVKLQAYFENKSLSELVALFEDAERFYASGSLNNSPDLLSIASELLPRNPSREELVTIANEVYRQLAFITVRNTRR